MIDLRQTRLQKPGDQSTELGRQISDLPIESVLWEAEPPLLYRCDKPFKMKEWRSEASEGNRTLVVNSGRLWLEMVSIGRQ